MNNQNIVLLIFAVLFLILFYMCYNNKKESFEGIAGTSFVSRVPKGTIVAYYPPDGNTTNIPAGWVVCDGKTTLQGNTNVPDLRGKFVLGFNPDNNKDPVRFVNNFKDVGGSETHKLTIPEMPSHFHETLKLLGQGQGNSDYGWDKGGNVGSIYKTLSQGGDQPHNNMPPYYVLIYIIKL